MKIQSVLKDRYLNQEEKNHSYQKLKPWDCNYEKEKKFFIFLLAFRLALNFGLGSVSPGYFQNKIIKVEFKLINGYKKHPNQKVRVFTIIVLLILESSFIYFFTSLECHCFLFAFVSNSYQIHLVRKLIQKYCIFNLYCTNAPYT